MSIECARRREFAELVANHFFGHLHGNMLLAVVDAEGETHELGKDRGATAPILIISWRPDVRVFSAFLSR